MINGNIVKFHVFYTSMFSLHYWFKRRIQGRYTRWCSSVPQCRYNAGTSRIIIVCTKAVHWIVCIPGLAHQCAPKQVYLCKVSSVCLTAANTIFILHTPSLLICAIGERNLTLLLLFLLYCYTNPTMSMSYLLWLVCLLLYHVCMCLRFHSSVHHISISPSPLSPRPPPPPPPPPS